MDDRSEEMGDSAAILAAASAVAPERYDLCLYITGMTPRSVRAIENVRTFCKKHLEGRHTLRIFDLYQQPSLAREEQLIAAPTLVKRTPLPQRRLVGDLSDQHRVLAGLGLPT
ncbi:MAG TPA: circadian clock KaiB family protein [Steroidobacteraceae bacterium]|nr:circadian clock KaiB family protein [Steroidobacteraceae bacterium]